MIHTPAADNRTQADSVEPASQHRIIDLKAVDWNRSWQAQLEELKSKRRDAGFWDRRAASFAKAASEPFYFDHLLQIIQPEAEWRVLDMGCGSGAVAVPLAKLVSSVIAVDFSSEMLAVVRRRCEADGISNVVIIRGSWEDDWKELGIGTCDVAIASRSMIVEDLQSAILKLNEVAKKRVYIVTIAGDGPRDRRIFDAVGRPFNSSPDYIYIYNMLYHMGLHANLAFISDRRSRTYSSPKEAAESMQWMFEDLTTCEKDKFDAYIKEHLVFRFGAWRFSYENVIRWAVMWWEKE